MKKEYREGELRLPEEMNYEEVVKPYREAFSGEPWYEVSQCIDSEVPRRCPGGLSSTAIGSICEQCGIAPMRPAYDAQELVMRFEALATTRPTRWYTERLGGEIAVAAVAWRADSQIIAQEKYADVDVMDAWLSQLLDDTPLIWLDEVFADKTVRRTKNLQNFGAMCRAFGENLNVPFLAFRTINEAMIRAAVRDFGKQAVIIRREDMGLTDFVPDRRDFVFIDLQGGEL